MASGSKESSTAKPLLYQGLHTQLLTPGAPQDKAQVEKGVDVRRCQRLWDEGGNIGAGQVLVGVLVGKKGGQEEAGASGGFKDRRND